MTEEERGDIEDGRRARLDGVSVTALQQRGAAVEGALASQTAGAAAPAVSSSEDGRRGQRRVVLAVILRAVTATPRVATAALSWWLALLRGHNDMAGAAAVARPTTRWIIFSKVAPDEHASAFGRLRVVGHQAKAAFALKPKNLELRNELTHARSELVRRHDDGDAAVRLALNETGLFEIGQQHFADPGGYTGRVGKCLWGRGALLARPGSKASSKLLQMTDAGLSNA